MSKAKSEEYTRSGVNIDAADQLIDRIKPLAESTRIAGAVGSIGGFGGVFDLVKAGYPEGSPRLVSGTDGVGTKLKVAFMTGIHDTIGIDCVAMCVNDILAVGARPLFFLDYFATGKLEPGVGEKVVAGIAEGCRQANCWLLGGETAEMPGMYEAGEYDLAGFVVGAVTDETELRPTSTAAGDVVIGVPSSGLHSNGFSLARRVLFSLVGHTVNDRVPGDDRTLGRRLLEPTRIYVRLFESLRQSGVPVRALAHITGGGLWENPQRSITPDLAVHLDIDALRSMRQPLFTYISQSGKVSESEMYRVFNMGVGLTMVVPAADASATIRALEAFGESGARIIGRLEKRTDAAVHIAGVSESVIAG
jgi:phosphoribosylformylglycinamidine cyclo-ligase